MVCHTKDNVTYSELIIIIHWDVRTEKHGRVLFLLLDRCMYVRFDGYMQKYVNKRPEQLI